MVVYDFSERKAIQVLSTQSRRKDLSPYQLSIVHYEIGKLVAANILELFPLEEITIPHPIGVRKGTQIAFEEEIIILTVMRAGLYFADGFRFYFQKAPFYHINPIREIGISEKEFRGLPDLNCKTVVLIDAVINTGNTIIPVIHQIQKVTPKRIVVSCMVLPNGTAKGLIGEFPHIDFCFTRISNNAYVGKGPTDTGNRLFGTI